MNFFVILFLIQFLYSAMLNVRCKIYNTYLIFYFENDRRYNLGLGLTVYSFKNLKASVERKYTTIVGS